MNTIELFQKLGIDKNQSLVLAALQASEHPMTGRELERITDLRQPQISLSCSSLELLNWIKSEKQLHAGKGRPELTYSLKLPLQDIIKKMRKEQAEREKEQAKQIDEAIMELFPEQKKQEEKKDEKITQETTSEQPEKEQAKQIDEAIMELFPEQKKQ